MRTSHPEEEVDLEEETEEPQEAEGVNSEVDIEVKKM